MLGQRAWIVCGSRSLRKSSIWQTLLDDLRRSGIQVVGETIISREPTIADVDAVTQRVHRQAEHADLIISIGGGSAIDVGKAVSAMATNSQGRSVREFLEGVGTGAQLDVDPLPFLVLPTTAGTGSEATKNAVISVDDPPCKKSLRSEKMIPNAVIIDPELTVSTSTEVTAASGMDAITQLIESLICLRANRFTQAISREGVELALPNLIKACQDGADQSARTVMSYAAFLSGVALANSGLGMAHGISAALGAICNVPHGLACAALLPVALKANREVSAEPLADLGRTLLGKSELSTPAAVTALINAIEDMCNLLKIPRRLSELGVQREQLPEIVSGSRGNSMNGNPREISDSELRLILEDIL